MHLQHRHNHQFILTFFTSALMLLASVCSSFANDLPTVVIDKDYPGVNGSHLIIMGSKTINANVILDGSIGLVDDASLEIAGDLTITQSSYVNIRYKKNTLTVGGNLTISPDGAIYGSEEYRDDTLIVHGNFTLDGKMKYVNVMEVDGNFYINNSLTLRNTAQQIRDLDPYFTVKGNLIHSKGDFVLAAKMEVLGDFRAQQQVAGIWKAADVYFSMPEYYTELTVHGNFYAQAQSHSTPYTPKQGIVNVKKDFTVLGDENSDYLHHISKLTLSGSSLQKVNYEPPAHTYSQRLTLENSSDEGVFFEDSECDLNIHANSTRIQNLTNPQGKLSGKAYFVEDMTFERLSAYDCDLTFEGNLKVTGSLSSNDIHVKGDFTIAEDASVTHYGNVTADGNIIAEKNATINLHHSEEDIENGNNKFNANGNIIITDSVSFINSNSNLVLSGNLQSESPLTVKSLTLAGGMTHQANIKSPAITFQKFIHNCISYHFDVPNIQFSDSDGDGTLDHLDFTPETAGQTTPTELCPAIIADYDNDGWEDFVELNLFDTLEKNPLDDYDHDGMPNKWESDNGLNALVADAELDPDNDGMTNLTEFINNSDPLIINIGPSYPGMENNTVTLSGTINRDLIISSSYTVTIPTNSKLQINGSLIVEGNAAIAAEAGNDTALVVTGDATIKGTASHLTTTTINGDLHVHDGATLTGTQNISSPLVVTGNVVNEGTINFFSAITVGNDLTIGSTGKLNEESNYQTTLTVQNDVVNNGHINYLVSTTVNGNFTNTGHVLQLGDATVANNLTTSGQLTIPSRALFINGNFVQTGGKLELGGRLNVLGNFTANNESTFETIKLGANLLIEGVTTINVSKDSEIEPSNQACLTVKDNLSILNKSYFHKSIKELRIVTDEELDIDYRPSFHGKKLVISTTEGKEIAFKNFSPVYQLDLLVNRPSSITNPKLKAFTLISGINFGAKLLADASIDGDVTFTNLDLATYDLDINKNITITDNLTYSKSILNVEGNLTFSNFATAELDENIKFYIIGDFITKENANIIFNGCFLSANDLMLASDASFVGGTTLLSLSGNFTDSKEQDTPYDIKRLYMNGYSSAKSVNIKTPLQVGTFILNGNYYAFDKRTTYQITAPSMTISTFLHDCYAYKFNIDPSELTIGDSDLDGVLDSLDAFPEDDSKTKATKLCLAVTSDFDEDGLNDKDELTHFGDTDQDGTGDYDSDGMSNSYEIKYSFNPDGNYDASYDADNDGFTNLEEYIANTNPRDASDVPGAINFATPTSGTPLVVGAKQTISWNQLKPINSNIELQYSVNSGTSWHNLATVPNSGSYEWTVHPDALSDQFQLKISGSDDSATYSNTTEDIRVIAGRPQSRDITNWVPTIPQTVTATTIDSREVYQLYYTSTVESSSDYPIGVVHNENTSTTVYQYGVFEGRLKAAPCAIGEGIVSSLFTYWQEENDLNNNSQLDSSQIYIDLLGHDPAKVSMAVLTAEVAPDTSPAEKKEILALYTADIRTGKLYKYSPYSNTFVHYDTLDSTNIRPEFNSTTQSYVYGFEWKEDFIEWYIYLEDKKVVLAHHNISDGAFPTHPAQFASTVRHSQSWYADKTGLGGGLVSPESASYYITWLSSPTSVFDHDNDGLPDALEIDQFGSCYYGANDDPDNDSLTNIQEYEHGTNASLADSDHDGMPDGWEVAYNLNPLANDADEDPDGDSLTNLQEFNNGSDPGNADGNVSDKVNITPVINFLLLN